MLRSAPLTNPRPLPPTTTAVAMARQGARVVCVSRTYEKLEGLQRVIEAEGGV